MICLFLSIFFLFFMRSSMLFFFFFVVWMGPERGIRVHGTGHGNWKAMVIGFSSTFYFFYFFPFISRLKQEVHGYWVILWIELFFNSYEESDQLLAVSDSCSTGQAEEISESERYKRKNVGKGKKKLMWVLCKRGLYNSQAHKSWRKEAGRTWP